jgi:hypothetical protein
MEKLHVVGVISNLCNYKRRYQLAKEFVERMEKNPDIELYIVELLYETNTDFAITNSDNKNHLQLKTKYGLWHKENMINLGVSKLLPKNWKYFAWIDMDIEFEDPYWAKKAIQEFEKGYDVIQLFEYCKNMDQHGGYDLKKSAGSSDQSKIAYGLTYNGHPGFAWAMNRKTYDKIGKIYDYAILDGGDTVVLSCILDTLSTYCKNRKLTVPYILDLNKYKSKFVDIKLGYIPVMIKHHFHGQIVNRKYNERYLVLQKHRYNPSFLSVDENGVLIPGEKFSKLFIDDIYKYFRDRNEDEFFS